MPKSPARDSVSTSLRAAVSATAIVVACGLTVLSLATAGGTVWTAEAARRAAVLERPQALPSYRLQDAHGVTLPLASTERQLTVVDFIFTQCPTVCLAMGTQFRQLQGELAAVGLLDQVQLLSVTFDPTNDDAAALTDYLQRFGGQTPHWRAARFTDDHELEQALAQLGVIVIPEPLVGFVHNSAYYLIENGHVVEIFDVDDRAALFAAIRARLNT